MPGVFEYARGGGCGYRKGGVGLRGATGYDDSGCGGEQEAGVLICPCTCTASGEKSPSSIALCIASLSHVALAQGPFLPLHPLPPPHLRLRPSSPTPTSARSTYLQPDPIDTSSFPAPRGRNHSAARFKPSSPSFPPSPPRGGSRGPPRSLASSICTVWSNPWGRPPAPALCGPRGRRSR